MTDLPTIKYTGLPSNFSGVVYADYGKHKYAAMVDGEWLKGKNGRTRWFKYEMEAGRAAYHEKHRRV